MPILVVCDCGARIRAADRLAGRAMFCPQCMQRIIIPTPARQAAPAARVPARPAPPPARPATPARPAVRPALPPKPAPVTETVAEIDDSTDTPAPRARPADRAAATRPRPRGKRRPRFAAKRAARPRLSPLTWAGIGVAAAVVIGTVWGTLRLVQKTPVAPRPASVAAASGDTDNRVTVQDIQVSARDLLDAYANSEGEADRRFQGNLLAVTGWVARLSRDAENRLSVEVKGSKKLESFTVKCIFRFLNEGEVSSLQPGQALMIKGRCDGKQGDNQTGNVILKDCRFVKFVPDATAVKRTVIFEPGDR